MSGTARTGTVDGDPKFTQKGRIMNIPTISRSKVTALLVVLVTIATMRSAEALPLVIKVEPPIADQHCDASAELSKGLRRIGTQFVRGDNLTGANVPAPHWVPEVP